jgi:hypothetical protein
MMSFRFASAAVCFAGLILLSLPGTAAPIAIPAQATATLVASCNTTFTLCLIPENIPLQLPFPFLAVAGDVVLTDPNSSAVSDVFRILNNVVDTGRGTGLGNMVFLYSSDDTTLPSPSTYSANVTFITEDQSGITSFLGNGTNYLLGVPEPQTFQLLSLAVATLAVLARRRSRPIKGDR